MVELLVSEFAGIGLAVLSDLLKLDIAVWHIIDRHVGVLLQSLDSSASLATHLSQSSHALFIPFCLSRLSQVFFDLLLALLLDEFQLEGVKEGLLVRS